MTTIHKRRTAPDLGLKAAIATRKIREIEAELVPIAEEYGFSVDVPFLEPPAPDDIRANALVVVAYVLSTAREEHALIRRHDGKFQLLYLRRGYGNSGAPVPMRFDDAPLDARITFLEKVAPRLVEEVFARRDARSKELEDAEKLGSAALEKIREKKKNTKTPPRD